MKNLKKVLFLSLFIGLLSFTKKQQKTLKVFKPKTEIYAGRFDKKPKKTKYNDFGLPIGRNWLTRNESKGKHIKNPIVKKRFKKWKENYQKQFIMYFGAECKKEYKNEKFKTIPPALVIAQAILESNYGLSRLASEGNNLFGVKFRGKKANNLIKRGFMLAYDDGPNNKFTRFVSQWAALRCQSYLLLKYGKRIKSKNPTLNDWLNALCGGLTIEESKRHVKNGGTVYATSCFKGKCYADKLRDIIKNYNLEKYNN